MRTRIDFNSDWLFEGKKKVRLPHNAVDLPFAYFDETAYQRVFTYEKRFTADPAWEGKEVSLCFDGAMANAQFPSTVRKLPLMPTVTHRSRHG